MSRKDRDLLERVDLYADLFYVVSMGLLSGIPVILVKEEKHRA